MNCRVCGNHSKNQFFTIREMQHGLRNSFTYFQCAQCLCIQIAEIPDDMSPYYPPDYYSFNTQEGNEYINSEMGFFKKIQAEYLTGENKSILGMLFTVAYDGPRVYHWIRMLKLKKHDHILDIGCGTGLTLKRMYQLGYKQLTGADPFIKENYRISETFHIYKIDPLDLDEEHKFDCIMMHHSFEHMEFEEEVLKKARKLLKPAGRILIRIPVVSKSLMELYGTDLVSLDAPRHFYIHSEKSMDILCRKAGLKIDFVEYDAVESSFWASEQYKRDVPLASDSSYAKNRIASGFSKKEIRKYKHQIRQLNERGDSDTAAFYISEEK